MPSTTRSPLLGVPLLAAALSTPVHAQLDFEAEQLVMDAGAPIQISGHSDQTCYDWNSDGLTDLIVGEGASWCGAKVRVYLNQGTNAAPAFNGYHYVIANGVELKLPGSG